MRRVVTRARFSGGLLLALVVSGCPKPPPTPDDLTVEPSAPTATETIGDDARVPEYRRINDAADLIEGGTPEQLERAIVILERLVERDPESVPALINLGVAQERSGDLVKARRRYQQAVDFAPTNGVAWQYLGQAQIASGQAQIGIANLRTGIRRVPLHGGLRVALVQALRESGDLDAAISEAKDALKISSNNLALYNNLGLAYLEQGDAELAKFVFRKGIDGVEGGDEDAWLHTNLGRAFLLDGDVPTARYYLERAVELDGSSVPALVYLSGLYLTDHNFADAVPLLEAAQELAPENHGVAVNLGVAYRGVERFDDAQRLYERALVLEPDDPGPLMNLAILQGDYRKDYDAAIALLEQYRGQGGAASESASEYIDAFAKEQRRAARRRQADDDARQRERDRAERERLLREAEEGGAGTEVVPTPALDPNEVAPDPRGGE